jgi:hypothetical protein
MVSQLAIKIIENPNMETKRKLRFAVSKKSVNVVLETYTQLLLFAHAKHISLVIVGTFLLGRQICIFRLEVYLGCNRHPGFLVNLHGGGKGWLLIEPLDQKLNEENGSASSRRLRRNEQSRRE